MSYFKVAFCNHIYLAGNIENRDFNAILGTVLTFDNCSIKIDDVMEYSDGTNDVCCIVTDCGGVESYHMIPAAVFIADVIYNASAIILPDYDPDYDGC